MTNPIAKTDKVSVFYPSRDGKNSGQWALRNISLSLQQGESLALIGEAGSGKTSLLRVLLGLISPTEGNVELFGENIDKCSHSQLIELRRRCGYVPQDPYGSLPPTLTVLDAVAEPWIIVNGRKSRLEAYSKARRLLKTLGIEEERILLSRVRSGLSGGQRQRVSIARSLILEPALLLCDEPTSMQDASTRSEIIHVLNERVKEGMAMVFVTHDLYLARGAAKRGIVLLEGECCEENSTEALLSAPKHAYTRALVAAIPTLSAIRGDSGKTLRQGQ